MTRFSFDINYIYINYTPSCCEVHIGTRTLLLKIFNIMHKLKLTKYYSQSEVVYLTEKSVETNLHYYYVYSNTKP